MYEFINSFANLDAFLLTWGKLAEHPAQKHAVEKVEK